MNSICFFWNMVAWPAWFYLLLPTLFFSTKHLTLPHLRHPKHTLPTVLFLIDTKPENSTTLKNWNWKEAFSTCDDPQSGVSHKLWVAKIIQIGQWNPNLVAASNPMNMTVMVREILIIPNYMYPCQMSKSSKFINPYFITYVTWSEKLWCCSMLHTAHL